MRAEANAALQAIQYHLQQRLDPAGQVRFPRGFLPTAQQGRRRVAFLSTEVLRTNVSYALMLGAVQRWILYRADLAATAQEMVVKLGLSIYGSVAEAVLRDVTRGAMGQRQRVASRIARLRACAPTA